MNFHIDEASEDSLMREFSQVRARSHLCSPCENFPLDEASEKSHNVKINKSEHETVRILSQAPLSHIFTL